MGLHPEAIWMVTPLRFLDSRPFVPLRVGCDDQSLSKELYRDVITIADGLDTINP